LARRCQPDDAEQIGEGDGEAVERAVIRAPAHARAMMTGPRHAPPSARTSAGRKAVHVV